LIVTELVPVEVSITVCVDGLLRLTLPKLIELILLLSPAPVFTTCVTTLEVAALVLVFPGQDAVMLWEPTARVLVLNVVLVPLMEEVPICVEPSRNVTVPLSETLAVAVNVTD
jgi:hypothetical protein